MARLPGAGQGGELPFGDPETGEDRGEPQPPYLDRGGIRYGTSSWTAKGWLGSFYPKGTAQAEYLPYYGRWFSTVEADVTYYRVPSKTMAQNWAARTPPGFAVAAKFPKALVHAGTGPRPDPERVLNPIAGEAELLGFLAAMGELGDKCGTLVLQFPYFNRRAFASVEEFITRLDPFLGALPERFRYAVEVRNKGWIGTPLLDVLRRHRVALVLLDLNYMPHPDTWWGDLDLVTADHAYVRLIGDRQAVEDCTDVFDRIVVDRSAALDRWARLLRLLREGAPEVYVYANNHFAGHAPATLRELAEKVDPVAEGPRRPVR